MFLNLNKPLQEGETFSGRLIFEKAGAVDVSFEAGGLGAAPPRKGANHL
jgi:copper(I)-binding protein